MIGEEERRAVIETFEKDGGGMAFVIGIDHLERSHCHTYGWSINFGLPELVAFGVQATALRVAPQVFDLVVDAIEDGRALEDGQVWPIEWNGHDIVGRFVNPGRLTEDLFEHALICRDNAGSIGPMPVYQLFWADENGRFPWDEGCSDFCRSMQPLLYEPSG
ncbi:DUF4262 domain-containing protein [Novosphingobium sp. BL-52-GroH]|uniref:DUF4262 domain-containing protein n=1 Tax=Novosphingobium sp. BL-52-GroH TaxID=3349877 RepID=UPI00384C08B4